MIEKFCFFDYNTHDRSFSGKAVISTGNTAYLSNRDGFIIFSYGGRNIRFKGPYSLTRFENVVEWDHGYLVVNAIYSHTDEPVEDYIDLIPILRDLYVNEEQFLEPIEKVEVKYA